MILFNIANKVEEREHYYFGLFDSSEDKIYDFAGFLHSDLITTDFVEEDSHPTRNWIKGYSGWIMVDATKFPTKKECRKFVSEKLKFAKKNYLKNQ